MDIWVIGTFNEPFMGGFYTRFFYKQHFYKKRQTKIVQKVKPMLSNTLRLNFCYLEVAHILHLRYHPKITEHILKNK